MANDLSQTEGERMERLNLGRAIRPKKMALAAAERAASKLEEMIAKGHDKTAFFIVLAIALLKDGILDIILDFLGFGLIPILGQIPGYFLSAVLFYLMWGKGMIKGRIFAWVLSFFIIDSLPFFKEFPFTTVAVLFSWQGVVRKTRQLEAEKERLEEMTEEEVEQIEQNYGA